MTLRRASPCLPPCSPLAAQTPQQGAVLPPGATTAARADSMQYSALKQINKIQREPGCELAWSYPAPGPERPLRLQSAGRRWRDVRRRARTARSWRSTPPPASRSGPIRSKAGPPIAASTYWESKDRSDRRLIFAANSYLQEINRKTGVTINTFGNDGRVDLREGLGRDPKTIRNIQSGTPGRVFENLIILGSAHRRRLRRSARRSARLRRPHRQARLDLPHHSRIPASSATRRGRKDAWKYCRRRQYLGRNLDRREARHRLLSARLADLRSLRRRPHRAPTCSATACSRSTRAPASASGTSSWCITICGTTT